MPSRRATIAAAGRPRPDLAATKGRAMTAPRTSARSGSRPRFGRTCAAARRRDAAAPRRCRRRTTDRSRETGCDEAVLIPTNPVYRARPSLGASAPASITAGRAPCRCAARGHSMDRIHITGGAPLNGVDPDLGRQERGAAADDREPAHRRDARADQRAAARRHRRADADPRQPRRRPHGRRQAARRRHRDRPDDPAHRLQRHRHHRALRAGLDHAGELLGDRAAAGPVRRGQGVAARRLRHRHPAGRSADHGPGAARRRDRDRCRLRGRQDQERPDAAPRSTSRR